MPVHAPIPSCRLMRRCRAGSTLTLVGVGVLLMVNILFMAHMIRTENAAKNHVFSLPDSQPPNVLMHDKDNALQLPGGDTLKVHKTAQDSAAAAAVLEFLRAGGAGNDLPSVSELAAVLAPHVHTSSIAQQTPSASFEEQRRRNLTLARNRVQSLLKATQQNPSQDRFLSCTYTPSCGFGCIAHRIVVCLHHAVFANRAIVLPTKQQLGSYAPECGHRWDCMFERIATVEPPSGVDWNRVPPSLEGLNSPDKYLIVSIDRGLAGTLHQDCMPDAQLAELLSNLSRQERLAWTIGQFLTWMLRPNNELSAFFHSELSRIGLSLPVHYGVHIRRTDKIGSEAKFHGWREYFQHIDHRMFPDRNYHGFPGIVANTTVYLATDDTNLFTGHDSLAKYKHNRVVWNEAGTKLAGGRNTRYSRESLQYLLFDLHVLRTASYFVGTFSSQVSRMVVELRYGDGSSNALSEESHSLDDAFYGRI